MSEGDEQSRKRYGGFWRNQTFHRSVVNDWHWAEAGVQFGDHE
jgi:hypothetical protein